MSREQQRRLVTHAVVVISLGLLAGFPWAEVITSGEASDAGRAWRMAHLEGLLNGLLMLAIAGCGGLLTLGARGSRRLIGCLMVAGYGNVLASIAGAVFGVRGLAPGGAPANSVVFLLFMAAVVAVFIAMALTLQGARRNPASE